MSHGRSEKPVSAWPFVHRRTRSLVATVGGLTLGGLVGACGGDDGYPPRGPDESPVNQSEPQEQGPLVSRTSGAMPYGLPTSCEIPGHDRFGDDANGDAVPQRLNFAACDTESDTPRMYVSVTLVDDRPRPDKYEGAPPADTRVGAILELEYDPASRSLVRTGNDVLLDQCDESHGITASADCGRVAVLCQRYDHASRNTPFTADLTMTLSEGARDWITQPDNVAQVNANANIPGDKKQENYKSNGEMWLLEWNGTTLDQIPDSYVIHKAISGSHLGNHHLVYAEDDNTYAASMFAAAFDGGGGRHSGDSFMVINRDGDWSLDQDRGWTSQCGRGHTLHNRAVYHPMNGKYYGVCTTDWTAEREQGGGFWIKDEESSAIIPGRQFHVTWSAQTRAWGGTHAFYPVDDGLLGTVVGHPNSGLGPVPESKDLNPFQIGLVYTGDDEMDMRRLRWINWIVASDEAHMGHPQLAPLGGDRFLLGYGEMYRVNLEDKGNLDRQVPWNHFVQVIDGQGNLEGEAMQLDGVGWGEQDQWVSLGRGRVAWAYPAAPTLIDRRNAPACSRDELLLSVYHGE